MDLKTQIVVVFFIAKTFTAALPWKHTVAVSKVESHTKTMVKAG